MTTQTTPAPQESTMQKVLDGFTKAVQAIPQVLQLAADGTNYVNQIVADFKSLASNPTTTQADVDALVEDIKSRSAQIQSIA